MAVVSAVAGILCPYDDAKDGTGWDETVIPFAVRDRRGDRSSHRHVGGAQPLGSRGPVEGSPRSQTPPRNFQRLFF